MEFLSQINFSFSVTSNPSLERQRGRKEEREISHHFRISKYSKYHRLHNSYDTACSVFDHVRSASRNIDLPIYRRTSVPVTRVYTENISSIRPASGIANPLIVAISDRVGFKCKTKRATSRDDDPAGVRNHGAPRTPSNSFNLLQSRRHRSYPPSISLLSDIPIAKRVWQNDLVTETREEDKTKNAQLTSTAFHDGASGINV